MRKDIFFLLLFFCLISCKNKPERHLDEFYTSKGGMDYGRIPLIKPYELTTSSKDYWIVHSVDTSGVPLNMPGAKNINVVDSVILVYGEPTIINGQEVKKAWFVISAKRHISQGFVDHQAYLNYLRSIGINNEPKLYNASDVFMFFDGNGIIDWKKIASSLKSAN